MSLPRTLNRMLAGRRGDFVSENSSPEDTEAPKNTSEDTPLNFVAIHAQYSDFVLRCLKQLGGRPADIADLQQRVFIEVHRKLATYDRTKPIGAWLFGICRYVAAHNHTKARVSKEIVVADEFLTSIPDGRTIDSEKHAIEVRLDLQALLNKLDVDNRALLVMYAIDGMSTREIARLFGNTESTVRSRLARARRAFSELVMRRQSMGRAIAVHDASPAAHVPRKTPEKGPDLHQADLELPRWTDADGGATPEMRMLFHCAEPSRLMSDSELARSAARVAVMEALISNEDLREVKTPRPPTERFATEFDLTPREAEIAQQLVSSGHSYKEIASQLQIQDGTLRKHVENIYRKIGVHSRVELVGLVVTGKKK